MGIKQELSYCWDGRTMLHNSNSGKMGWISLWII